MVSLTNKDFAVLIYTLTFRRNRYINYQEDSQRVFYY